MKLSYPFTLDKSSKQAPGLIFWGVPMPGAAGLFNLVGDASARSYFGTAPSSGVWVPGHNGGKGAQAFDGNGAQQLLQATTVLVNVTTSCWIKCSDTTRNNYLFAKWGIINDTVVSGLNITTGTLFWAASTTGLYEPANVVNGSINCADGKWHNIICTYDSTTSNIYVDGVLDATISSTGLLANNTTSDIRFGGLSDGAETFNWFNGVAEDLRIYNRVINPNIVKDIYRNPWALRKKPNIYLTIGGPKLVSASNTLTFSQVATDTIHLSIATNTISFSEKALGYTRLKSNLVFTESATVNHVAIEVSNNTLVFREVAEGDRLHPASSTLTFSQTATTTITKGVNQSLALSQSISSNYTPHFAPISQSFVIASVSSKQFVGNKLVNQTFTINQLAVGKVIKIGVASNLFVVNHEATTAKFVTCTNTLTLTQSAVGYRLYNLLVHQNLVLNSLASRNTVLHFNVITPLVFLNSYNRPTNINGYFELIPIINVIGTKITQRVIFRSIDRSIILRPAELNDAEANTNKIVLQRTMFGGTYIYARKTETRLLKYSFQTDTFKALEMRKFMLDCMSVPIWLENWKGEIWVGYFTKNPFEETTNGRSYKCGDSYSFSIEFEGQQVH